VLNTADGLESFQNCSVRIKVGLDPMFIIPISSAHYLVGGNVALRCCFVDSTTSSSGTSFPANEAETHRHRSINVPRERRVPLMSALSLFLMSCPACHSDHNVVIDDVIDATSMNGFSWKTNDSSEMTLQCSRHLQADASVVTFHATLSLL
jgi:hypothetical protein